MARLPKGVTVAEIKDLMRQQRKLSARFSAVLVRASRHAVWLATQGKLLAATEKKLENKARKRSSLMSTLRSSGPNVRDVAATVMKSGKPMTIHKIAEDVLVIKGGRAGENYVQNLGAALMRDPRFKRVERGVYALKSRRK